MCCSNDFKTFLNKQNERAIKNLHVFCTNKDKGCGWQGEVNDITSHLKNSDGCQFEEVKCSNNCGLLFQRQYLASHVDYDCPCREVHCQYCNMIGQYQFIEVEHVEQCSKVPLPCPNKCGVDILHEDMEIHRTTCPLEEIECPNDYHKVLQQQYLTNHINTECPCCQVNCQYCQMSGKFLFIEGQHKEECPKLPIPCPNKCEVVSMPREDMEEHRQECPLELIECEYYGMGCHAIMVRKDQHGHEKEKVDEHLLLTKTKLVDTKANYEMKINKLEFEFETKISGLEFELQQNRALMKALFGEWTAELNTKALQLPSDDRVLPVVVQMSEYTNNKKTNADWYSDPFYTHKEGYKM